MKIKHWKVFDGEIFGRTVEHNNPIRTGFILSSLENLKPGSVVESESGIKYTLVGKRNT